MLISLITAWIATLSAFLTGIKIFVKKNQKLNRIFHSIHKPLGTVLIAAGIVHGLLAGNVLGTSLSEATLGGLLFSLNMGTLSLIISMLLALNYIFRKALKGKWMACHRILTLALAVTLVIHIFQMGISLPKALISGSAESSEAPLSTESSSESLVNFSGANLKDGTYEGSAQGFNGEIKVSVSVSNGAVTDISIISQNDTPNYFNRAKEIINNILGTQSLEVDAISGATYSSKGIRDAVYNALQQAVEDGELAISEIQVSGGHGGHGRK